MPIERASMIVDAMMGVPLAPEVDGAIRDAARRICDPGGKGEISDVFAAIRRRLMKMP